MEKVHNEGLSIWGSIKLLLWVYMVQVVLAFVVGILVGIINVMTSSETIGFWILDVSQILIPIYLINHVRHKRGFEFDLLDLTSASLYIIALVLISGYRLVYDNSLALPLSSIEKAKFYVNTFNKILCRPITAILLTCVVAPVFEETLFRGVFLKQLSKRYSKLTALTISSLLFALIHFNLHQSANAVLLGFIFGFIYLKTNSLSLSIFAHFVNNVYGLLMGYGFISIGVMGGSLSFYELSIGIILLVVGFYFLQKTKLDPQEVPAEIAVELEPNQDVKEPLA
ncbi:MAG TPA: CPBP family intramembrane metalloprotease [Natronincola sp.]|nr:CPBP family intramembrane metalloprotease [Natronincola sp.]